MLKSLLAVLLVATSVSAEDSPLVALAKRVNRTRSKAPVITNETVANSKGRFSMPAGDVAAATPVASRTASSVAAAPASTPARAATPAPAPTPRAAAPAATVTAPSVVGMIVYAQTPNTARNIEPQSSARTIAPASTASTINPTAAAPTKPASSAQTIQPQSTARTIQPQAVPVQRPPQ